ncbi:MAG: alpha/beta hydrolase [Gaiellaceae bacterium]
MLPWPHELAGRLDEHVIASEALRGNPLGDPHERPLWIYVPPGIDSDSERRLPAVYVIQGFTGQLDMWRNRVALRRNFLELADELFASGGAPPTLLVFVDAWTSVGGSQYLDSPGTGRYHTYLCDEVVPWVDARYRTLAAREHRAIAGKSSGGYGAMVTAMLRPDLFGALATHAGDALFETCYLPDFPIAARTLRDNYESSWDRFWAEFRTRPAFSREGDDKLFELWGYAAAYSADDDGTVRLPFDSATGALVPDVWARWLALDPVRMAPAHADALRSMRAIWIDAGKRDQWFLDLGAQAFQRALDEIGVGEPVVRFELFDATHMLIEYRYPLSLAFLAERLSEAASPIFAGERS